MNPATAVLILGSASPRRAELLAQLGLDFRIVAAAIDETPRPGESPRDYVHRMAREKSQALAEEATPALLITADTTVALDGRSLGKPKDLPQARQMLTALSGRSHEVYTAVCARQGSLRETVLVRTIVEFSVLTSELIDAYLATDEPWDKAGAYALQGLAGSFVRGVEGSVSNVIGLPLVETRELLLRFGLAAGIAGPAP